MWDEIERSGKKQPTGEPRMETWKFVNFWILANGFACVLPKKENEKFFKILRIEFQTQEECTQPLHEDRKAKPLNATIESFTKGWMEKWIKAHRMNDVRMGHASKWHESDTYLLVLLNQQQMKYDTFQVKLNPFKCKTQTFNTYTEAIRYFNESYEKQQTQKEQQDQHNQQNQLELIQHVTKNFRQLFD